MDWFEFLLFLHILSFGTWFGSSIAILVIALRSRENPPAAGPFYVNAGWWASKAHPAAGVVLLLSGILMVSDSDFIEFGDTWVWLGLLGLVAAMGVGGALIGRTGQQLEEQIHAGGDVLTADARPLLDQLLVYVRIELAIVVLVVLDMVAKPGT